MYSRQLLFKCVHVDYISLYDTACNGIVWSAIFILCVVRFLGETQTQISLYIYDPVGLAYYAGCDPVTARKIKRVDQLMGFQKIPSMTGFLYFFRTLHRVFWYQCYCGHGWAGNSTNSIFINPVK